MNTWRFIESPPAEIFFHMALDRELFDQFARTSEALPILRIYRVTRPAVTVGRSHRLFLDPGVCARPTGGGLVRHGDDLIYSVIARRDSFPTFGMVRTSYLSFHEAVQEAMARLGIDTRLFRCDEARLREQKKRPERKTLSECFKEPVATDVLLGEKKVAGGGQWRKREGFLHQGSVQLLRGVSFEDLRQALKGAFERKFDIVWETDGRN